MIKYILIIVVALLALSYFGFNLQALIQSPTTQSNFSYVATAMTTFWNNYLKRPATYVWNEIFVKLIWGPAIENMLRVSTSTKP